MYSEEKSKGFMLKDVIIKLIFLVLFVFLLIWLFPKMSDLNIFYSNIFRENISYMQEAGESYFTKDMLPTEVGETVKITLQEMIDKNLIIPFADKDGNSCNVYSSYVEVTKNEDSTYTLKTNLICNTESNYIEKKVGCNQYCEGNACSSSTCGDLQYEYKKAVTTDIVSYECDKGYSRSGKYCYKTTVKDKEAAKKVYSKEKTVVTDAIKNNGTEVKIKLNTIVTTTQDEYYCSEGTLVGDICRTKTDAEKTVVKGTATKEPYSCEKERTKEVCTTTNTEVPYKCNCSSVYKNGKLIEVCDTCTKTVPVQTCTDVTTTYIGTCYRDVTTEDTVTYSCSKGTLSGTSCIIEKDASIKKGTTTYKCPEGTTSTTGENATLACYKTTLVEGDYYCKDADATLNVSKKTCTRIIPTQFTGYKCSGKYKLKGLYCYLYTTTKVKAKKTTSLKTTYEYKWSCKTSLEGWIKTGKTR